MRAPTNLRLLLAPLALVFVLFVSACGDVGDAPRAETGEVVDVPAGTAASEGTALAIDTARSRVEWRAAKVTRAHEGGFRTFSGTVSVDGSEVTAVRLLIDTRSIWSDTDDLTSHLRSDDFFEVEAYPEAVFEADRIVPTDSAGATHLVTGNLTMHGQTHGLTFPATIAVQDGAVRATADFIIDRTQWGILYKGKADDLVRNDVRLLFDVVTASDPALTGPVEAAGEAADSTGGEASAD